MATVRAKLPHQDRTATEPRQNDIHPVVVDKVESVNSSIKLFKLKIVDEERGVKFLPGQWLDVLIPGLPKAGGFTLTSTPTEASPSSQRSQKPILELAVQKSDNPPAAWLHQPPSKILGTGLRVRVGGSFVWPPPGINVDEIENVIFVAGGVGINPLISMLSHLHTTSTLPPRVSFLYSTKLDPGEPFIPERILFLPRLQEIVAKNPKHVAFRLFITSEVSNLDFENQNHMPYHPRRITQQDLLQALVTEDKTTLQKTVCFVCGPPIMTDDIVAFLEKQGARVFCEKWW